MTMIVETLRRVRLVVILAGLACTATAQILQNRPELCGLKAGTIPVPSGVTAAASASSFGSVLTITRSSGTSDIPFGGHVEQVCPLAGNRLLALGQMIPGAYYTGILDLKTAKLVDGFESWFPPVISPDQRWLIMRAFYPAQSDAPFSEEYLLYDLTKGRSQNTMPSVTQYTEEMRGRVVYPAVDRGIPFEHFNLPDKETHMARSTWFYWASDSSAVLFADSVQETLSAVLVRTDSEAPKTYIHAITPSEICEQGPEGKIAGQNSAFLMLSDAEVSLKQGGDRLVVARFRSTDEGACRTNQVILHEEDFKAAPLEVHPPIVRNRPVITIEAPRKK
jgi:hypothetical protein